MDGYSMKLPSMLIYHPGIEFQFTDIGLPNQMATGTITQQNKTMVMDGIKKVLHSGFLRM